MANHNFDTEIAARVGVNAAIIFQNILFWCEKNAANDRHFYDGQHWTYNSVKAWGQLFPYMTAKQIRTALDKLEEVGLIVSGSYSEDKRDRTKWYSPNGQLHLPLRAKEDLPCRAIAFATEGKSYNIDTDNKHADNKPVIGDNALFDEFWEAYPHRNGAKKGKQAALKAFQKAAKKTNPHEIIEGARRYQHDRQAIDGFSPDPATWLNQARWNDDIEPPKPARVAGQQNTSRGGQIDDLASIAVGRALRGEV